MWDVRESRRIVAALILGGAFPPSGAMAQGFFATPSVSVAEIYDDNLFLSGSQPQEDFISRLSSAIEAGYRSVPLSVRGHYLSDAEFYARHPELDTTRARASTAMDVRYQPTRLITVSAEALYTKTQRPGELNPATGVELGRAQAERLSLGPSAVYRFDPLTAGSAAYTFTCDRLEGAVRTDTHTAVLGLDRRMTERDTASVGYAFRRFRFGETDAGSHAATLGGTHAFTPRTSATLLAGPRFSEGSIDPEVSAAIRHKLKQGELSLIYARSPSTVIGQAGVVDTETFGVTAAYVRAPAWEMRSTLGVLSSTRAGLQADVQRMELEARYRVTRVVSFTGSYQFSVQRGSLDGAGAAEIVRNVILLGIVVAAPAPADAARPSPPPAVDASL